MNPIERSKTNLGAKFIRVTCTDEKCKSSREPDKILYDAHNGYENSGGVNISGSQRREAENVAQKHNQNHRIRIVEGE